ncbi:MAG: S24 family peptidase [Nocardioidaceae bacterium]
MGRRIGFAVVRGRSMLPTLSDGDRLLVVHGAVPRAGRLVVVRLGDVVAVKRAVRRDPAGWWVERDNPAEGVDSWSVGAVGDEQVLATVLCRVWPVFRRVSRKTHSP